MHIEIASPSLPKHEEELPGLSTFEQHLFARQMMLPSFGELGQKKLRGASVMISRVGGLGGTAAMLLARAGVGKLVLAHGGTFEHADLNRMHLAFREHLGLARMPAFIETLQHINPDVELVSHSDNVNAENVEELMAQADVVLDAAPDFVERYVMNTEAVRTSKPLVMAAMSGLEGYVTTIRPGQTPCLSCLFPVPPHYWDVLGFPVIAPTPACLASMAAMEVIKLITGCGETLDGQLLYCDMSNNNFSKLRVARRSDCTVCSKE